MKTIILGITGSIAAYKTPDLVRRLRAADCDVYCVLTQAALRFVTPASLESASEHQVNIDLFDPNTELDMPHIELADNANLVLVAPASANTMAHAAHGSAPDLLSTILLATKAPVVFSPAMNVNMWEHPATQRNVAQLRADGAHIIEPATGKLACGWEGKGRLPEIDYIVECVTTRLFRP